MNVVRKTGLMQAVNDRDHVRGPSNASITVVHYGDFKCPFSREGARVMKEIEGQFDGQLRTVFRHFPLTTKHPHAQQAAEAAEAAAAQGKFREMAEVLFANQHKLAGPYLTRYAMELGMNTVNSTMTWQPMSIPSGFVRMCSAANKGGDGDSDVLHQRAALRGG